MAHISSIVMGNCFGRFLNYNQTTVRIFETMQYPYFLLKFSFPLSFIENLSKIVIEVVRQELYCCWLITGNWKAA